MPLMPKILVFDFDGVLVDSNEMKYQAWLELFPENKNFMREVLAVMYHNTRFTILRHVFQTQGISGEEMEQKIQEYAAKYNAIVQQDILRLGLIPGVYEALKTVSRKCRLYINSGTMEGPLRESVRDLGISHFFAEIFGAPRTKYENLARVMHQEQVSALDVVMIGDGEPDYQAARRYNMYFIGVANAWNKWQKKEFPLVSHIAEVDSIIKTYFLIHQKSRA